MTVNAITDTKKGEQGLRLLIFILPFISTNERLMYKFLKNVIILFLKRFL